MFVVVNYAKCLPAAAQGNGVASRGRFAGVFVVTVFRLLKAVLARPANAQPDHRWAATDGRLGARRAARWRGVDKRP